MAFTKFEGEEQGMKKKCMVLLAVCLLFTLPASMVMAGGAKAPDSGTGTTVNYRTFRTDDEAVMQRLIAKFEQENPGIKINYSAERDEDAYYQKLQADLLSGKGVDIFELHGFHLNNLVKSGNILDISDLAFNRNYDPGVASITTINGKNYGYAPVMNLLGVFYNKTQFQQMGINVPKTFDQLRNVVAKSRANGYGGISYIGGDEGGSWLAHLLLTQAMGSKGMHDDFWMKIATGAVTDINSIPKARMVFDTMAVLNKEKLLYDHSDAIQYDQSIALFVQGKASMMIMGTWEFANLDTTYAGIDLGVFPMLTLEGASACYAEVGQIVSIYSKTPNAEAAKKWIEFLSKAENAQIYATAAGATASINGVTADFKGADILNALKAGGIACLPVNDTPNFDIWNNIIQNLYSEVLLGSGDVNSEFAKANSYLKAANLK
jgi:raffinose/stachyose/melibiose transport system substrate-binding protein